LDFHRSYDILGFLAKIVVELRRDITFTLNENQQPEMCAFVWIRAR